MSDAAVVMLLFEAVKLSTAGGEANTTGEARRRAAERSTARRSTAS